MPTDNTAKGKGRLIDLDEIVTLDWIENLIPPRTEEEDRLLLESLEDEGQNTPVLVTKIGDLQYVLVDGHGRYQALKKLNADSIWAISRKFKNEQDIKDAMLRIQLGRRNISENVRIRLIGEIWNRTKQTNAGQADPTTRKEVAAECNTSESTVKRAASYAAEVAEIVEVIPSARAFFDDATTPRTIVKPLRKILQKNPDKAKQIIETVAAQETDKAKNKVFKEEIEKLELETDKPAQAEPSTKNNKSRRVSLSSEVIERVLPVAKANNLSLTKQIENLILEGLADD